MARGAQSETWIKRRIAEGRGQGDGRHYKPWILIGRHEFSSRGRSHICPGAKCHREHHLLSDLEKWVWLFLEWSAAIIDIREQFPLFPREVCWQIAKNLGMRHPYDTSSGTPRVLTTDFLCSMSDAGRSLLALSAKYESELAEADEDMLARLELERRFWEHFGVPWRLITDRDIPHPLVENLEWLADCEVLQKKLDGLIAPIMERLAQIGTVNDSLRSLANLAAAGLGITEGDALSILCHLIWHRDVKVNLDERLSASTIQTIVVRADMIAPAMQGVL